MVPDFSGLHKPSCSRTADYTAIKPPEPTSGKTSSQIQSFLQPFCKKPLPSSSKPPHFCKKPIENDAKHSSFLSTFRQNDAPQIAASYALTQPTVPERGDDALFYQLWLDQPSWSPIILTKNGWITVKSNGQEQVPLTFSTVESYYRRGHIIGKRFGQLTGYLMLDIDINSVFHPDNGGFQSILAVLECLGLCRYLIVRSSTSGGIHLYFPLPEPVNSWQLATTVHRALTAGGIAITGGQCELFPNKKSFNAEFNGHRLPLQDGSFLLDDDFCPFSNDKADFLDRWQTAAAHQDEQTLQLALTGQLTVAPASIPVELPPVATPQKLHPPTTRTEHVIPPIAWTRFGQSNNIMCELVNYGDRYVGLKNSTDLAIWIKAVAPQLPGYQRFASPKSKHDIEYGTWAKRWSESHFRSVWLHKVGGSDHNANVARDAKSRIFAALDRICVDVDIGITKLFEQVTSMTKRWFDRYVSWRTFKKYEDEIRAYIKRPGVLGLSSTVEDDVNSFSPELTDTQIVEPEFRAKRCTTQLLTLRCVVCIYSNAFTCLHTSKNEPELEGGAMAKSEPELPIEVATAETALIDTANQVIEPATGGEKGDLKTVSVQKGLTEGQMVRIVMPGGSLDGLETRVLAQTVDVLGQPVYRLDYQRQGQTITLPAECLQLIAVNDTTLPGESIIRATAAQLFQVLGKACPFVGPGLWTVKRDEVSATAWGQLKGLVGGGVAMR